MFFRAREINARFKVVCTQKPKDRSSPSHSRHFLAFCSCDTMGQSCSASNIDNYARWKQCTTPSCLNVAQMLWTALWSVAFDFVMLGNMWLGFVWKNHLYNFADNNFRCSLQICPHWLGRAKERKKCHCHPKPQKCHRALLPPIVMLIHDRLPCRTFTKKLWNQENSGCKARKTKSGTSLMATLLLNFVVVKNTWCHGCRCHCYGHRLSGWWSKKIANYIHQWSWHGEFWNQREETNQWMQGSQNRRWCISAVENKWNRKRWLPKKSRAFHLYRGRFGLDILGLDKEPPTKYWNQEKRNIVNRCKAKNLNKNRTEGGTSSTDCVP